MLTVRSNALRGLLAGLGVALAAILAGRAQPLSRLELLSVDTRMRLASPAEAPPITIIGITQEDVQEEPLPWSRQRYAQAIAQLHRLGARVIVLDLYFPRPSPPEAAGDDVALAQAIREAGNVVLPVYAKVDPREQYGRLQEGVRWLALPPEQYLERNIPLLASAAARQGHINLSAHDPDHIFRRVPAAIGFRATERDPEEVFYALSVQAAGMWVSSQCPTRNAQCAVSYTDELRTEEPRTGEPSRPAPEIRNGRLHIGGNRWPLDEIFPGCLPIDFSAVGRKVDVHAGTWRAPWGRDRSIFLYSFSEFLREDFPVSAVRGRIVFVGSLLYERHPDVHPTPAGQQPGVIIHALGTQTLLGRRYPRWLSAGGQAALTVVMSLVVATGCFVCRFRWSVALLVAALVGLAGAALALFETTGLLIETVTPAMGLGIIFVLSAANTLGCSRSVLKKRERELDSLVEMGRISASLVGAGGGRQLRLLDPADADVLVPPLGSGVATAAETVGSTIRDVLGAEVAACFLVDPEAQGLSLAAASGVDVEDLAEEMASAGAAAARLAVRDQHPILWHDGKHRPRHLSDRVTELLCVPMTVGDRVAGAMAFFNKTVTAVSPTDHFTRDDLRLVTPLTHQAAVTLENARLYQSMHRLFLDAIKSLAAAIDAKDPYTRGHTARVAQLCGLLGRHMSLTSAELQVLHLAATLHDIGKIAIPEAVLNKPTELTPEERRIVEKHPVRGAIILEPVRDLRPIIPGIRHHHERYDGAGYPDGLVGEAIPLLARVMAIADAFDAMTSDRPYRRALTEIEALDEMARYAATQFDGDLAGLFLERFPSVRTLFTPASAVPQPVENVGQPPSAGRSHTGEGACATQSGSYS